MSVDEFQQLAARGRGPAAGFALDLYFLSVFLYKYYFSRTVDLLVMNAKEKVFVSFRLHVP